MVGLDEAKIYLKLESNEEDTLVSSFLETSTKLCLDILRKSLSEASANEGGLLRTAILYGVAYLYEHCELANHKELKETLFHLLLADRKDFF